MKNLIYITIISMLIFSACTVEIRIDGCTDPIAYNYDPQADDDDGSCLYVWGCTDQAAINYNPAAVMEASNDCEYSCEVVYYLDYSAAQYMINWGISYYDFYDGFGNYLGYITNDWYWNFPPNCIPQNDGSTLTASLSWFGNYGSNTGIFSWLAYADDGILDYEGDFVVYPNECAKIELSAKKIQDYKESKKKK